MFADEHQLDLSLRVTGAFPGPDGLKRHFVEKCKEDNIVLTKEPAVETRLILHFHLEEVHDRLLHGSDVKLFQGSCNLVLAHQGAETVRRALHSKVISDRDVATAGRKISHFLLAQAYRILTANLD